jgi:hypothetical protein
MPLFDWLSEDSRVLIAGAAAGAVSRTVVRCGMPEWRLGCTQRMVWLNEPCPL